MRKLSQRELLDEGFRSAMSGVARGLRNATGSIATAIAPENMAALKAGASIASGAIERIRSGSPSAAVGSFFDSEEGKREFRDIKIGKERKLANQNWEIPVKSGYFLNSISGSQIEEKDLSGGYLILRRNKRGGAGGFDNEIIEVLDSNKQRLNDRPIKFSSTESPESGPGPDPSKPKFFAAFKQWKINNIGPEADDVGVNGHQMKKFLVSLGLKDPDRVIADRAGLDNYGKVLSSKQIDTIESLMKSRGLVSESKQSQKNILRHFNIKRYR